MKQGTLYRNSMYVLKPYFWQIQEWLKMMKQSCQKLFVLFALYFKRCYPWEFVLFFKVAKYFWIKSADFKYEDSFLKFEP